MGQANGCLLASAWRAGYWSINCIGLYSYGGRLLVNQLYPAESEFLKTEPRLQSELASRIESFANQQLDAVSECLSRNAASVKEDETAAATASSGDITNDRANPAVTDRANPAVTDLAMPRYSYDVPLNGLPLYLALCSKNHRLLSGLFRVYADLKTPSAQQVFFKQLIWHSYGILVMTLNRSSSNKSTLWVMQNSSRSSDRRRR